MNASKTIIVRKETNFLALLTLIFIAAKLFGAIQWSWFWVLSPILIPWMIALVIIVVFFIVVGVISLFERR